MNGINVEMRRAFVPDSSIPTQVNGSLPQHEAMAEGVFLAVLERLLTILQRMTASVRIKPLSLLNFQKN